MSRDEIMYLQDIAESCRKILRFTEGLVQGDLLRRVPADITLTHSHKGIRHGHSERTGCVAIRILG